MDSFDMQTIEDVLKSIPENDSIPVLELLASKLEKQFELAETIDDLNAVVKANEEDFRRSPHSSGVSIQPWQCITDSIRANGVKLTPHDDPNQAMYLNDL